MNQYLAFSSLFFASNTIINFAMSNTLYAFLFFALTIASTYHHCYYKEYSGYFDKIALFAVILYGGTIFWNKKTNAPIWLNGTVVGLFLLCGILYYCGYATQTMCFSPNIEDANQWHMLMHAAASIGHHIITFME